jgi:hypothetical protein
VFNTDNIVMTVEVEKAAKKEALIITERTWRDAQYENVVIGLDRISDNSPSAAGTISQWRDYREALRQYPQQADFPQGIRPSQPA